mmetsp:Transcript_16668/g.16579  ORF Transcript_16668/g.16579 Transcript_16668/m.16579 type:complete len:315 (+) Transcript_16668:544-1488(+)
MHLDFSCFQDQELMSEIDISKINKDRFQLKCQKCNTKNGACVQCHHGRCTVGFHPLCARNNFLSTRDKTGFDDMNCYCSKHRPLRLRKQIESLEKKSVEDILYLGRALQKFEARKIKKNQLTCQTPLQVKRQRSGDFSYEEKLELLKIVEARLAKEEKPGFKFAFTKASSQKKLRGGVQVSKPLQYTVLHPQIILLEKIALPGRKYLDCYKLYNESIFPIIKKEIQILGKPLVVYEPTLREKAKLKKYIKPIGGAKRGRKPKQPVLEDLVSQELHCLCRKPFVEATPKRNDETDEDYEQRIRDSEMIACDECGK